MWTPVHMCRRVVKSIERGESIASAARRLEVSERGLRKLLNTVRRLAPLDRRKHPLPHLDRDPHGPASLSRAHHARQNPIEQDALALRSAQVGRRRSVRI